MILVLPWIELTKEAQSKLTTLVECLNLDNESTVINELFYKFVLDQDPDKRRMIMSVYQITANKNNNTTTADQH